MNAYTWGVYCWDDTLGNWFLAHRFTDRVAASRAAVEISDRCPASGALAAPLGWAGEEGLAR